jgi:ADP-ribose pyrophosphatase
MSGAISNDAHRMATDDPRPAGRLDEPYPSLLEQRLAGESVFQGKLLKVYRDHVRAPDGHEQTFEYTLHPGAAVVIPVLDDGRLVLERQWRYPLNRSFLEFPAGKLNPGEDPLMAVQRELTEETGYRAGQWAKLGEMHPVIAYSTEVIHLFMAKSLTAGDSAREQGECLELVVMTPDDFFDAIHSGEITDSKTLSCAVWLDRILRGTWQPVWQNSTVR